MTLNDHSLFSLLESFSKQNSVHIYVLYKVQSFSFYMKVPTVKFISYKLTHYNVIIHRIRKKKKKYQENVYLNVYPFDL